MIKYAVLDHGFVELVDLMGDDQKILKSARVSTGGSESKGDVKDRGLIRYLYKNKHLTPFEQVAVTFHIKAPIFVVRQWFRHRTQSYNEYSARYSEMIEDFYVPSEVYKQSDSNHQGRAQETVEDSPLIVDDIRAMYEEVNNFYHDLLEDGVAKEQARVIMPVGQYTEFYTTMNLRNLFAFLTLRLDEHAQYEIRLYAETMLKILEIDIEEKLKWSVEVFKEFYALEQAYIKAINACGKDSTPLLKTLQEFGEK